MKKLLLFFLCPCFCSAAMAQVGSLDPSFGYNGIQTFTPVANVTTHVFKVLVAPDKSLFVIYSSVNDELITVAKYFSDGTIDTSFGAGGYTDPVPMTFADASVQADGKVVLAGSTRAAYYSDFHDDLIVYRFTADGYPDLSFNNSGFVTHTYMPTSYEFTTSVTVSSDMIVVTGYSLSLVGNLAFYHVDVYDMTGAPVSSFLFGDITDAQTFDPLAFNYSVAIQDQKIVLATSRYDYFAGYITSLLRFNANGTPDNSFDQDGIDTISNAVFLPPLVVTTQGDKILVAGSTFNFVSGNYELIIARYNNDGSPDSSFNGNGWQTVDFNAEPVTVKAILTQGNKIIVGGNINNSTTQQPEFILARFNDDGSLDNSFDGDGKQTSGINFSMDEMVIYENRLFATGLPPGSNPVSAVVVAYLLEAATIDFACAKDTTVFTDKGLCTAVVSEIGPFGVPSPNDTAVSYTLSGATTASGIGSVSGNVFNKGTTIVTYSMIADPLHTCTFNVTALDGEAPLITNASATVPYLWPPDHKMRDIEIRYKVTDNCGGITTALSVVSNEAETGLGRGDIPNDWQVMHSRYVRLRAERYELGNGRIYTVTITATDAAGNISKQTVDVTVPLSAAAPKQSNSGTGLKVKVLSNPAYNQFTLFTSSSSNKKISVRVTNELGMVVETLAGLQANGMLQLGSSYRSGLYAAEIMQGDQKITVKLVKLRQ